MFLFKYLSATINCEENFSEIDCNVQNLIDTVDQDRLVKLKEIENKST